MSAASGPESKPQAAQVHRPVEALGLLALGLALSIAISVLLRGPPDSVSGSVQPLLLFLAWVGPAYAVAARRGHDPLVVHAVLVPVTGLRPAVLVSVVVLALYAAGFLAWTRLANLAPTGDPAEVARGALTWLVWGFLFTALPEEYFFRGVLQPALDGEADGPGRRRLRVLGADLGPGALVAALAFGAGHVAIDLAVQGTTSLERGATFFAALWFAWLRARTGSVLPAAVAHAVANAVFYALHKAFGLTG